MLSVPLKDAALPTTCNSPALLSMRLPLYHDLRPCHPWTPGKLSTTGHLTMVEVQAVSHALACRTVAYNDLSGRVTLHHQDLRAWSDGTFDLVTGSPPYLAVAQGVRPRHPQKAAARFELHGDVYDYCQAAARSLAAQGVFCFCYAADDPRPEAAIARAGLTLVRRQQVYF